MSVGKLENGSIVDFFESYGEGIARAFASVSRDALRAATDMLLDAMSRDASIYVCGNGGSAAISNHLICDHAKGIHLDTGLRPRVQSLSVNMELLTATANDLSYAQVFSFPLSIFARPGDLLITISSSGNSENIVEAVQWAKKNGVRTIAMTGFSGGRSARLADVNLHVDADNYGIIEDVHQSIMHTLSQFVRVSKAPPGKAGRLKL